MMFMIIDIYYVDIWCNLDILAIISETCKDEGISCDVVVDYNDNAHCIDLISSLVSPIQGRIVEKMQYSNVWKYLRCDFIILFDPFATNSCLENRFAPNVRCWMFCARMSWNLCTEA